MDEILAGIPHLFIYLDDVLVASLTVAEHKADLQRVMERLRQHRLFISKEVPALQTPGGVPGSPGGPELYLAAACQCGGHHQVPQTVHMLPAVELPGMINFYRRLIRGAASILNSLTDAIKVGMPKHRKLNWQPDMEQAFKKAKVAMSEAAILAHPQLEVELFLAVDASNHHMDGVLQQKCGACWQPLAFFSRKLNTKEAKYSTLDRKLLACVAAIRYFC